MLRKVTDNSVAERSAGYFREFLPTSNYAKTIAKHFNKFLFAMQFYFELKYFH